MYSKITTALRCKCLIKCLYHLFEIFIGEYTTCFCLIKRMDHLFEIIMGLCIDNTSCLVNV